MFSDCLTDTVHKSSKLLLLLLLLLFFMDRKILFLSGHVLSLLKPCCFLLFKCIFFFASILANKLKLYFAFLFKQMTQGKKQNENKIKTKDKLNYSRIFCIQVCYYMANCQ